jgi:DNA primase
MPFVKESCKQAIRQRVPLEDLLREYNVHLVPSGRKLKALCPFHAEKTPSFQVDVEKQYYYCFGCQEGGDLFRFVQSMHRVDFSQALEILARRAGVDLVYEAPDGTGAAGPSRGQGRTLLEMHDALALARDFYHRFLLEARAAEPAREYLRRRRISPEMWERFHLGFSPPEWEGLMTFAARKGVTPRILEAVGLARRRTEGNGLYDYFRGRLMFPITDPQDRMIGFGGRTLGEDVPKYLNTPKTPVFDKSQVLYGLAQARTGIRREGRIGVVEGYTDAIMAHQAGLDFFVASLGTAFTRENARRLGRLAPRALLVFDGDDAGQRASERSLDLLVEESLDVRIYTVRDGKDPCDAILALGGDEFRRRFDADSVGLFEFKWRRTVESVAGTAPALKARALDEFLDLLARVPNVVARKLYLREFSERLGIPEEDIEARMRQVARRSRVEPSGVAPEPDARAERRGEVQALGELAIECILALPHRAVEVWERVPREAFDGPPLRAIAAAIDRLSGEGKVSHAALIAAVEDPDAARLLVQLLSRTEDRDGNPSRDYEEAWSALQRDLQRFEMRRRAADLKRLVTTEEERGSTESLLRLRREYFDALRELKKV